MFLYWYWRCWGGVIVNGCGNCLLRPAGCEAEGVSDLARLSDSVNEKFCTRLVYDRNLPKRSTRVMGSSVSLSRGSQEGMAYNTPVSAAPAITRCSSSISSTIWSVALCCVSTWAAPTNSMINLGNFMRILALPDCLPNDFGSR